VVGGVSNEGKDTKTGRWSVVYGPGRQPIAELYLSAGYSPAVWASRYMPSILDVIGFSTSCLFVR